MAGSINDKLSRVSDSDTGRPVVSSLASSKALGATSITVSDATNWTTTSKVYFAIYNTVLASGLTVKDATSQTEWQGTLSGTTISNLILTGGTDRTYNAGAIVELTFTAKQAKDLYDNISTHANQDGSLKTNAIYSSNQLADGLVTSPKIALKAVDTTRIDYSTITAIPTSFKFVNQSVGYNLQVNLSRIGNTVFWNMNSTTASSVPQSDSTPLGESIPLGYRPYTGSIGTPIGIVAVGSVNSRFGWFVATDGSMMFSNTGATSGAIRVYSSGSWATGDAWPT